MENPKQLKLVMIVGRYFAGTPDKPDFGQIDKHITLAREAAAELWNLGGFGVFAPHLNIAHFEMYTICGEAVYQQFDRQMLEKMDAIFVLPNWRYSTGGRKEACLAMELNIPIFDDLSQLCAWRDGKSFRALTQKDLDLAEYAALCQKMREKEKK